ncbi:MAG: ATP-binding protein [Candidatus Zhuqueibacterota bacterium]
MGTIQNIREILLIISFALFIKPAFSQIATKITALDGKPGDYFGTYVDICGDYAVIGSRVPNNSEGVAYVFKKQGDSWVQQTRLQPHDKREQQCFGRVAIDGDFIVVTAEGDNENGKYAGAAYIFERVGEQWIERQKIAPIDGHPGAMFGMSVDIEGEYIAIGAVYDNETRKLTGAVYIFKREQTGWLQHAKLIPHDKLAKFHFGWGLDLDGDQLAVGAPKGFDKERIPGAVYMYKREGSQWIEQQKIYSHDIEIFDSFGSDVSLRGNCLLVGANSDDDNGDRSGAAYIFRKAGKKWKQEAKIVAKDGNAGDRFGLKVELMENNAIIGVGLDDNEKECGSVYIFEHEGNHWLERTKIIPYDGQKLDYFGANISVYGNYMLVGANGDDDVSKNAGSAYIYNLSVPSTNSLVRAGKNISDLIEDKVKMIPDNPGEKQGVPAALFQFHKIKSKNNTEEIDANVQSLSEDNWGNIWIATRDHGLFLFDEAKNAYIQYLNDAGRSASNKLTAMFLLDGHSLLLGTEGNGIYEFDCFHRKFGQKYRTKFSPEISEFDTITHIFRDSKNYFWIVLKEKGVKIFDKSGKFIAHTSAHPGKGDGLSSNKITSIVEGTYDRIWIGTLDAGLNELSAKPVYGNEPRRVPEIVHYKHDSANHLSLECDSITVLLLDGRDHLWMGTLGGGLNEREPYVGMVIKYRELKHDFIRNIAESYPTFLWLTGADRIMRYNYITKDHELYLNQDHSLALNFNSNACFKSRNGTIYFGGDRGFVSFHPDSGFGGGKKSRVVFNQFNLFGVPAMLDTIIFEKKLLILNSDQKIFSFDFMALDFPRHADIQYAYKMEGFHDDWIFTGNYRQAHFTHLSPGDYSFRVKAFDAKDVSLVEETQIRIRIIPPWYRTIWAYSLFAIGIALLIFGVYKFQVRRISLRNELQMKRFEAQQLLEMDRMKNNFFANISHEFRTPLTLILGPLNQLINKEFDGDPREIYLMMKRNGKRLLQLINQLLDLSKLEAEEMSLQIKQGNVVNFLRGIVFSFMSLAERKKISLQFNCQLEDIEFNFDKDKLEKIMSNLLSNAFKFTEKNGAISVHISVTELNEEMSSKFKTTKPKLVQNNNCLKIDVADTGIGIAPDQLGKIFDRFYQADNSSNRKFEGTGIGLALTKELVELHSGVIEVKSEPGKGSTFSVLLPFTKELSKGQDVLPAATHAFEENMEVTQIPDSPEMHQKIPAKKSSELPLVLIVEDNRDVIWYIRSYLDNQYRILEAEDGEIGLNKAIQSIPDLIVSDVMMPNMDGFEFCEKIRRDERTSHIPLILLTAKAAMENKLDGLDKGADDYLVKPFNAAELLVRMKNLIDQRKKLRERFSRELTLKPKDITVTSADEKWLTKLMEIVENHLSNSSFDTPMLAKKIGLSRSQLHRKLVALTDQAPNQFIRLMRLRRAARLIEQKSGNITEIAYEVGFSNISYFSNRFREQFGVLPSEYKNSSKK